MVLELLVRPNRVSNHKELFLIGSIYSFISVFLSIWIFKGYASIVMITLTVVASLPFVHKAIEFEEHKYSNFKKEGKLLREHRGVLTMLIFLFLGFVFSFCLLYIFLPSNVVQNVFSAQMETIVAVNPSMPTGNFASFSLLFNIIFNNLKILLFCVIFSFFFGAGAIFILTWNASVMATAIGAFIKSRLFQASGVFSYFQVTALGLLQYLLHGIPEISGYFVGALASGLLSFALMNKDLVPQNSRKIFKDASVLLFIAALLIFISALIEVFITPFFM